MKAYLIGSSHPNIPAIMDWLTECHVGIPLPEGPLTVSLLAAKRCYRSFDPSLNANLTRVRSDWVEYFHNILSSGHGSVLEHVTFTFAIEDVSRVLTAELNRHRAGVAISEASGRYIVVDENTGYYVPDALSPESLEVFHASMRASIQAYKSIMTAVTPDMPFAQKKAITSAARRILPIGLNTGGVWTFNLRALIHILQLRSSAHAEEEIRKLALMLYDLIPVKIPGTISEKGEIIFECGKV